MFQLPIYRASVFYIKKLNANVTLLDEHYTKIQTNVQKNLDTRNVLGHFS